MTDPFDGIFHDHLEQLPEPKKIYDVVEVGVVPRNGFKIYRRENGVGGHQYLTDEFGFVVWDTTCCEPDLMKQLLEIENGSHSSGH